MTLEELSDEHIRQVLSRTARLGDAAAILGIDPVTLYRRRLKWQTDAIHGQLKLVVDEVQFPFGNKKTANA